MLSIILQIMRLLNRNNSLEVFINFASLCSWHVCYFFLNYCFLGFRWEMRIVSLLQINLIWLQLLLSHLKGINIVLSLVVWMGQSSLRFPVSCRGISNFGSTLVNNNGCLVNIATSKNTRLQILVLTFFAIKSLSFQRRIGFNCSNKRILPIDTRSH